MGTESQSSSNDDAEKNKSEHIKQRLKDMGVSVDSVRPEKSLLSKYGKIFMAVTFCALLVAYWFEYNKQDSKMDEPLAESNEVTTPLQAQQAYPHTYSRNNNKVMKNYRAAPWARPPVTQGNSQHRKITGNNEVSNGNRQQNYYPYYVPRYPVYPRPYWSNYPGYYPAVPAPAQGYGNRPFSAHPPAYGGYPYHNGWQR